MLVLSNISTGYGQKPVLHEITLDLADREIVAIIGPNGAGKSTVLKAVFGLLPLWQGTVTMDGITLHSMSPAQRRNLGLCLVPQGKRVFPELSVLDNLRVGGIGLDSRILNERVVAAIETFPFLKRRMKSPAGVLSGGEQQQLALARAMVSHPKVLLLDEPSLGLSPSNVSDVMSQVRANNEMLNTSVLIVEQKVTEVLRICHRVCALKLGQVAFSGTPAELTSIPELLRAIFL